MPQPSCELRSFQAPVMMFYRSNEEDEAVPSLHHYHEGYEIYYLFNGYRAMAVESKEYMLRPGDLLLLTKPLGVGIINAARRVQEASPAAVRRIMPMPFSAIRPLAASRNSARTSSSVIFRETPM